MQKIRGYIRKKTPFLFNAIKGFVSVSFIKPLYLRIYPLFFPHQERFDPQKDGAEIEYFNTYARKVIEKVQGRVLDIGCGYGYLTKEIAEKNEINEVVGIDKIDSKEFRCSGNKIEYIKKDISKPLGDLGVFDAITSTEFIEHISESDFKNLLVWIFSSLKAGGVFVGSTPLNPTDKEKFSDSPFHIREYQPHYFKEILEEEGFINVVIEEYPSMQFFFWEAKKRS